MDVRFPIAVEVRDHNRVNRAPGGCVRNRSLEGAIAVSQQHIDPAAVGIPHNDVWLAVAIDVARGYTAGRHARTQIEGKWKLAVDANPQLPGSRCNIRRAVAVEIGN